MGETLPLFKDPNGRFATERIGLVLPTSLCATQIARLATDRLNAQQIGRAAGVTRFVTFTHTEGCGFGGETMYQLLQRTYRGYLTHPNVTTALLLEHGCEKVPNDIMRRQLEAAGIPLERFGWASVQLDGGIEKAIGKVEQWFGAALAHVDAPARVDAPVGALSIALLTAAPVQSATATLFALLAQHLVAAGGTVLLAEADPLLANDAFRRPLLGTTPPHPTLLYGEPPTRAGLHVVASETDHWVENITGFGGCGAHLAVTIVGAHAQQGHPMVPVLQLAEATFRGHIPADDIDFFLTGELPTDAAAIGNAVRAIARGETRAVATTRGFVDFQLTRGLLGLTT